MKVLCINADNKPAKIALDEWIQEGTVYTVVEVIKMGLQPGKLGFQLKEVALTEKSFPYKYYDSNRFLPIENSINEIESIKEEEMELDLI